MNATEFSLLIADWRARCGFTDAEAAGALGIGYGTLQGWLTQRGLPTQLAVDGVVRQIRSGLDPRNGVEMTPEELSARIKVWRFEHGLTQNEAAVALGAGKGGVRRWESDAAMPHPAALVELLHRMDQPVDVEAARAAVRRAPLVSARELSEKMRAWRKRNKFSRRAAAEALGKLGVATTDRTVWVWESERSLPNRPEVVMAALDQPVPSKEKPLVSAQVFASRLRRWRKARGLRQSDAARLLGVGADQAKWSKWERCRQTPRLPVILNLFAKMEGGAK